MFKARMEYEKTGVAAYISHLDLMQVLQRGFVRASLPVKYSEGFNPHIYLSVLAPLSTGHESVCELCDFDFTTDEIPEGVLEKLNAALPVGIKARVIGQADRPVNQIANSGYRITLQTGDPEQMAGIFAGSVVIEKRSKRGSREVDLKDYIRSISFAKEGDKVVCDCVLAAGNDPLNPSYIVAALQEKGLYPAELGAAFLRTALLDQECKKFWEKA